MPFQIQTNYTVAGSIDDKNRIKYPDVNKTCGMDGIYVEHLKHFVKHIVPLLAMCIGRLFCNWIFTQFFVIGCAC